MFMMRSISSAENRLLTALFNVTVSAGGMSCYPASLFAAIWKSPMLYTSDYFFSRSGIKRGTEK
jgi:hypothetical protein